jgi:trk system potassium uptake protein TrkA
MRVIVVGVGEVGFDVARILAQEQHDVAVVDNDPDALTRSGDRLDVMTCQGSGTAAATLVEAGVEEADMLVAVTSIDEVNIIACMMADRLGVETTIARVRTDELTHHEAVLSTGDFGIDVVIHPEESAAAEVSRLIHRASATDVLTFADERLQLVGMRIGEGYPVVGKTLREVATESSEIDFRIMAVVRGGGARCYRAGTRRSRKTTKSSCSGARSTSRKSPRRWAKAKCRWATSWCWAARRLARA